MTSAKLAFFAASLLLLISPALYGDSCTGFKLEWTLLNKGTWQSGPAELKYGQGIRLTLSGPTKANSLQWFPPEGTIRDYSERIIEDENEDPSTKPKGFEIYENNSDYLKADALSLYFKKIGQPSSPDSRTVKLSFVPDGTTSSCPLSKTFVLSKASREVELYTSDHRSEGTSLEDKGRVIDDHFIWHNFHQFSYNIHNHQSFLHWHHLYIDRYMEWRKYFGYSDPLLPINPGTTFSPSELFSGHNCKVFQFPPKKLFDGVLVNSGSLELIESRVVLAHNDVHRGIDDQCKSHSFGTFGGASSPKSQLFWRFHLYIDETYYKPYCMNIDPKKNLPDCPKSGNL